jgi:hypothetical protein
MLSASLRPGRWPGLRALTTPPLGTFRQLRDGRQPVDHSKWVDAGIEQAYVDIIVSAARHSPPFADTANGARIRPSPTGHGIERNSYKHRNVMHQDRERFVGASIELRT